VNLPPSHVYALLIIAPLTCVDGAVLHRLFGGVASPRLSVMGERTPRNLGPL
jgi:hypothetical protein